MAQLHRSYAPADASKSPAPTVEQLLRGGEPSRGSPSSSSSDRSKHWDPQEDHSHHQKKSVLTKVKEKAKKLRHSLSKKKHDDNAIPSLVEDEDAEDTEYLGAPMYESELAPEQYKEKAMQHPRANAITEKHVMLGSVKSGAEGERETPLSPSKSKRIPAQTPGPSKAKPVYTATHSFPSKFLGLSVEPPERETSSAPTTSRKVSSAMSSPKTPRDKTAASKAFFDASVLPHASSAPATPQASARNGYSDQIWDKGVSVKEYLMNKLEPGEDDRALSQVISEAMSPKRNPEDKGVMEKVRDAVTSLLRNDEPSQHAVQTPVTQTSAEIPVSTNAYEGIGPVPVTLHSSLIPTLKVLRHVYNVFLQYP
ncbi:uncharacterized protein LOC129314551 isoform X2 [Prosopis cineraria]|uniref:uncharacterized protein LOC129314551 isoform X2 n=1 Tax=Prosopis cineraria TaxID=364024 RepID=UPI00241060BD|nr:uncharacterized protein LOC129314551 isoform X2 [Prosopis cineraria]